MAIGQVLVNGNGSAIIGQVVIDHTSSCIVQGSSLVEGLGSYFSSLLTLQNGASAVLSDSSVLYTTEGNTVTFNTLTIDNSTAILSNNASFSIGGVGCTILAENVASINMIENSIVALEGTTNYLLINGGTLTMRGHTSINDNSGGSDDTVNNSEIDIYGTLTLGNSSGSNANINMYNFHNVHLVSLGVHGSLTLNDSAVINIGDSVSPSNLDGSFIISTGASVTMNGSSDLELDGTLTITGTSITLNNNPLIKVGNGSMLPYFTFSQGAGHTMNFTDASYHDGSGGAITSWSWDFGDSNNSTSQNPSHTYASAGTYAVVLTTTDASSNTATCKISVTVA